MLLLDLASFLLRFKLEGTKNDESENQHSIVFGSRYYNIDALDADLPTLQRLQALRLYRNYICRRVKQVTIYLGK